MSEAPATRRELQNTAADLESALSDTNALLPDLMTKLEDLGQAVKDAEDLSHDVHDDIEWLRTSLAKVIELVRYHGELHEINAKMWVTFLNHFNLEERRQS